MTLFLTIFGLLPIFSMAGSYTQGNGGHVIVCEKSPTSHYYTNGVTLLDLEEGHTLHGFTYNRLASLRVVSLDEAFKELMTPFTKGELMELPVDYYESWFSKKSLELKPNDELPLFPGSSSLVSLKPTCRIEQAAIQYISNNSTDYEAVIEMSRKFWENSLGTHLKAALLFHEYTFRYLRFSNPLCRPTHARLITSFLLSDQAYAMTPQQRINYLKVFYCRDTGPL